MLVCARILVRLAAGDQTDHGPGRGKIKGTKCRKYTTEREEGRGGDGTGGLQNSSPQTHPPGHMFLSGQARPSAVNSNSTHSQTEINRILRYTELSIKIFAQMIAARRGKLQDAANVRNLPNEAEITGLESAERRH